MELFYVVTCVFGGCFGIWGAYSIVVKKDYIYVGNGSNTQLPYAEAVAPKFAILFGVGGICLLALPILLASNDVPVAQWHYPLIGVLGLLAGIRWILVCDYKNQYSPFMSMQRPRQGIFYSHTNVSRFSEVVYILDFENAVLNKYGAHGKPTKNKLPTYDIDKVIVPASDLARIQALYRTILIQSYAPGSDDAYPEFWDLELLDSGSVLCQGGKGRPKGEVMELHTILSQIFDEHRAGRRPELATI